VRESFLRVRILDTITKVSTGLWASEEAKRKEIELAKLTPTSGIDERTFQVLHLIFCSTPISYRPVASTGAMYCSISVSSPTPNNYLDVAHHFCGCYLPGTAAHSGCAGSRTRLGWHTSTSLSRLFVLHPFHGAWTVAFAQLRVKSPWHHRHVTYSPLCCARNPSCPNDLFCHQGYPSGYTPLWNVGEESSEKVIYIEEIVRYDACPKPKTSHRVVRKRNAYLYVIQKHIAPVSKIENSKSEFG